jgi:hypothetical protein
MMDDIIDNIEVPESALNCRDIFCTDHKYDIERFHNVLIHDVCINASKQVLPSRGNKKNDKQIVPGWSEYVAHRKHHALACHWAWKHAGRPNSGVLFEARKQSRLDYHYALKKVKENDNVIRSERMAQAINGNDHKRLWSEVKSMKGRKSTLPLIVDDVRGEANIADVFAKKYEKLYTSVKYSDEEMKYINNDINNQLSNFHSIDDKMFNIDEFNVMIKKTSTNEVRWSGWVILRSHYKWVKEISSTCH